MKKNTIASLLHDATKDADDLAHGVNLLAATLAQWMEKMHGGDWRIHIDHDAQFVLVVPRGADTEKPISQTSLREVV